MRSPSNSASGRAGSGRHPDAVGDLVADVRELGRGEMARQLGGGDLVEAERVAGIEDVGEGDFLAAGDRLDVDVIILDQQGQLLGQIVGEQAGLGDADPVVARRHQPAERAHRRGPIGAAAVGETDLGIGEAAVAPRIGVRGRAVGEIGGKGGLQAVDRGPVEAVELGDDGGGLCHRRWLQPADDGGKTGSRSRSCRSCGKSANSCWQTRERSH